MILKWAESKDGFIDQDFKPTKISNELASQFVHQIRSEEHAILVGTQTALNDNPSLTTRLVEGRNPVRILIDFDLKVQSFGLYFLFVHYFSFQSRKRGRRRKCKIHQNF